YLGWISNGVAYDSDFIRRAGGRNAFRIASESEGGFSNPSRNVYLKDNLFQGWIDPRKSSDYLSACSCTGGSCLPAPRGTNTCPFIDGSSYCWQLVLIGNNVSGKQSRDNIVLEDNDFVNAQTLLTIGASSNVRVFNNYF